MNAPVAAVTALHIGGGIALTVWLVLRGFRVWRYTPGGAAFGFHAGFSAAAASGCLLVIIALLGRSVGTVEWLFYLHVGLGAAAAALAAWHRRPWAARKGAVLIAAPAVALLVCGITMGRCYDAEDYYQRITSTNPAQAKDPLFPSGARVSHARRWTLPAEGCGRTGCHEAVWQSWLNSAHFYSASGPLYRRAEARALERGGPGTVRWCRGCHAPLEGSVPSEARVGCHSCHAMRQVPDAMGNGSAWYAPPPMYPFAGSRRGIGRWMHDFLVRVRPDPHRFALGGPDRSAAGSTMCLPCHRLGVNIPQNHYRYVRYDDTWMDWQNGPWSGRTVHTFDRAPAPRTCAGCHFAGGTVADAGGRARMHALTGSPAYGPDAGASWVSRLRRHLRVEIFALRAAGGHMAPASIAAPAGSVPASAVPGEEMVADVLVESREIGHAFPTGEPDLCEMWLDFRILGPDGRVILQSGVGPSTGIPWSGSHTYGLVALDREGKRLRGDNVFEMVATAYQRVRGTGQADAPRYRCLLPDVGDVARYRFRVPASVPGPLLLDARLWYRPVNRALAERTLPGQATGSEDGQAIRPDAAVVGEDRITLAVRRGTQLGGVGVAPRRWFAYGAALLVQKDTARARAAFQIARDQAPSWPDVWVALGRAYMEEGDLLAARTHLLKALSLDAGSLRARAWLGRVYRLMGRYDEALKMLRPLANEYPMDRLTWLDIGLCLLQKDQLAAASDAFRKMLDADPNDAVAHFNLMQCYRRLLRISDARREEVIYRILQEAEPPAVLLQNYARAHPDDYREAQPLHEHILVPSSLGRKG